IRFALFGDERCNVSVGANRNCLLLDTLGSLAFSADDDTLCRSAVAPDHEDTALVSSSYDPTEFRFFADRASALDSMTFAAADFLAAHEALLGRAVADVTGCPDSGGRVALTMPGLAGDSGMGSSRYYLALTGASRERLLASEETYRSALRTRAVV